MAGLDEIIRYRLTYQLSQPHCVILGYPIFAVSRGPSNCRAAWSLAFWLCD